MIAQAKAQAKVKVVANAIGDRVSALESSVSSLNSSVTSLNSGLTSVKGDVTSVKGDVTSVKGDVTSVKGVVTSVKGDVASVKGDVASVKGDVASVKSDVVSVKGDVASVQGDVNALAGDVVTLGDGVAQLGTAVDTLDGKMSTIDTGIAGIDGKVDGLDGGLKKIDGKVDGLDGGLKKIDGKVDGLDGGLKKIDGKVDGMDGSLQKIDAKIDGLDNSFKTTDAKVTTIDGNVATMLERIGDLEGLAFEDLPGLVQQKLGVLLDGDLQSDIVAAFDRARETLQEHRQALASLPAFLAPDDGGPQSACGAFRAELRGFLGAFAALFGSLPRVHPDHPTLVGLDGALDIVDALPCQPLFFLSQAPIGLSGATAWLPELAASFPQVSGLFDSSTQCQDVAARQDQLRRAIGIVKAASVLMKVISAKLHDDNYVGKTALALVPDASETTVGLHGYASVTLEQPKEKNRFSNTFKKLSELLENVADFGSTKVDQCELVASQQSILDKLELRETVIEEAIQASEGRLRVDVIAEINRLGAEMNELSERSLESDDRHRRSFDEWTGLALQLEIEEILSRDSTPVATLQLPADAGGLLDLVRDVVEATIAQTLASGGQVHSAEKEWRRADQHFAEGSFKEAYRHYAKAYRSAVKADGKKSSDEDSDSD